MPKKKKTSHSKDWETAQIEKAYRDLTAAERKRSKKRRSLLRVVAVLAVILVLCVGALAGLDYLSTQDSISLPFLPTEPVIGYGVSLAGVDVGGMTQEEAIAAVNDAVGGTYYQQPLVVTVLDQQLEITPAVSGADLNVEAAVAEALTCGTPDNPNLEVDVLNHLNLNEEAVRAKLEEFSALFPTEGTHTSWEITSESDQETLVLTLGQDYYEFDGESLYDTVMSAYARHILDVSFPCRKITAESIDLDDIYAQHCTEPVEAVMDKETFEVSQSVDGYRFDLEAAREALANAQPGDVLEFPFSIVKPQVSTEELEGVLFRDVLGSYTAKSGSIANRNTNLKLACKALNGIVLNPGETFSYNAALGQRTKEKGYKPANVYENGKTVVSYGGGICQPSSCLYYCTLIADLEIVERVNHYYISDYVPYGMDATVSWGGPDFKFRNNTDYPIRIEATASGGTTSVKLIGTDTKDYYVEMEYEVLSKTKYKTVTKEVEPGSGHKDGEVETTPYTGYKVQTYKCKYDKETDQLITREKEAYSKYDKRDKVVYKVVKTTEPTETKPVEEPTEKPTEKPTETTAPPTSEATDPPTEDTLEQTKPSIGEATG